MPFEFFNIYNYINIMCEIHENIIPHNFNWRAGIGTEQKPVQFQTPGDDYIEQPPEIPDPFGIRRSFLQSLDNKPSKVELPQIKKSKQDQYWDAVLNNGVVWKTGNDDTRPETQAELKAQQNPEYIIEPNIENKTKPNEFNLSMSGKFVGDCEFTDIPINGLPNINF